MWCRSRAHAFQVGPSFEPVVGPLLLARTRTSRGLGPGVFSPTSCPEHSDCPLNLSPLPGLSGTALFSLQTSPWENLLCPVLFSACLLSPCKCLVLGHMAGFRSSTWGCMWAAFGGTFRSQVVSNCPMTFWETGVAISTISVDLAVSLAVLLAQSSVCYINFQHGSVLLMSWHFHPQEVTFFIPGNTCWSEISFIWYRDSSFLLLGVLTAQLSLSFYFEPICDFVFVSVFLWGDCLSLPRLIEQNTTNWAAYKRRTFISPNWRLDVQNQSDGRFHVWWGPASWFIDSIFLLCLHLEEAGRGSLGSPL